MKYLSTCLCTFLLSITFLHGQDGTLDPTFGENGILVIPAYESNSTVLSLLKHEDKLYAAGFTRPAGREIFTVTRINIDGTLDAGFGEDGFFGLPYGTGFSHAESILMRNDGKLLVGGWGRKSNQDQYIVACITTDGVPDSTFGENGIAYGTWGNSTYSEDEISDMALLSNQRLITVARSYNGSDDDVAIACFEPDGTPCSDFGMNGVIIIEFSEGIGSEKATAVTVDADNNIYVGGSMNFTIAGEASFFIVKLKMDGAPDLSFGSNGHVFHTLGENIVTGLNAIAIDASGKIITGGGAFDTDALDNNFFMTRYTQAGVPDPSFGDNGVAIFPGNENESITDIEILPSGNILAAGSTGGFPSAFLIARVLPNGTLDKTFGTDGWTRTVIESVFNGIESIALDNTEGAIYAGGYTYSSSLYKMALTKYRNEISGLETPVIFIRDLRISPNPVSYTVALDFELAESSIVRVDLYDLQGRHIACLLMPQELSSGVQSWQFGTPPGLSTGGYILSLSTSSETLSRHVTLIRE